MVTQDDVAQAAMMQSMGRWAHGLVPVASWEQAAEQVPVVVGQCVEEMSRLVAGHDAFDVLVFTRQLCLPMFGPPRESAMSIPAAVLDVIALVLLGLGLPRAEEEPASGDPRPGTAEIIPALVEQAQQVLGMAALASRAESSRLPAGLGELSDAIRSSETQVRGRQYPSIARSINESILSNQPVRDATERVVGFTYDDAHAVGVSVEREIAGRYERARKNLGRTAQLGDAATAEQVEAGRAAASALFIHPQQLHTITAERVAALCGIDATRVALVLDHVSVGVETTAACTPEGLVTDFVNGSNAMAGVATVRRTSGEYLVLAGAVLEDEIRRSLEPLLIASPKAWRTYEKRRKTAAETRTADLMARLLGLERATYTSLKYLMASRGVLVETLSCDAAPAQLRARSQETEADCLIVVDHVAFCVEVKAGALNQGARRGDPSALVSGLKRTVIEASSQAERLRSLIRTNGGLWSGDLEWIDLSSVTEVHLIVVCLDDLGPLGISSDAMARAGLLPEGQRPWIVSLHDLSVVAEIIREPAQFLAWLRRRTQAETARLVISLDELDLLMYFVQGNFYFEPDPVALHARYPSSGPARPAELRRYARQSRTMVSTLTDDLDAWMYQHEGMDSPAPRPQRREEKWVQGFITYARQQNIPGWLLTGADLVGSSGPAQKGVARGAAATLQRTVEDGQHHSSTHALLTPWGYAVLIFATSPGDEGAITAMLRSYMLAKKRQLHADRVLCMVLDGQGHLVHGIWLHEPQHESGDPDEPVTTAGLIPLDRMPTSLPPPTRSRRPRARR